MSLWRTKDPSRIRDYDWDGLARTWVDGSRHALWRSHSDAVNSALLELWLPQAPVARILKTDAFDEAVTAGVYPVLARHGGQVVSLDVSTDALRAARARYKKLQTVVGDVRALPYRAGSFDIVVSLSTLDHFDKLDELRDAVAELARVLPVGGQLIITLDNLLNPLIALRGLLPFAFLKWCGLVPYPVGVTCGPFRLRSIVESSGLEVVARRAIVHCPRVLAVHVARLLERFPGPRARRLFLRWVGAMEVLDRLPTRYLTGHFVALLAVKR